MLYPLSYGGFSTLFCLLGAEIADWAHYFPTEA